MPSTRTARGPWAVLALLALAVAAVAAGPAGRYTLTLLPEGDTPPVMLALVHDGTAFTRGEVIAPGMPAVDVTRATVKDAALGGTLTWAERTCDLTAAIEKAGVSGTFAGTWGGAKVTGRVIGRCDALYVSGYRGDGTCVARDANPPVAFNAKDGTNVRWTAMLPNWCIGAPVATADRVFVMSEPDRDHDFPLLNCLDAKDGTVLWQREIDPLATSKLPDAQKDATRKAWHEHLVALRNLYTCRYLYATATDKEAVKAELEAKGCEANGNTVAWKSDGTRRGERVDVKLAGIFNRGGLWFDVWHLGGLGRIGYAYPTPITDGERVYVATGNHAFACFDLDGNLKWQQTVVGRGSSNAGYGGDDFCKNARSPILYRDLLIADIGLLVRAFDRETGELRWSQPIPSGHGTIVSPVVITVGGVDVLLAGQGDPGMAALRLPEGTPLKVEGWSNVGGTMLVKGDEPDVVFFTGGGEHGGWANKGNIPQPRPADFFTTPACVRFRLDGDKLVATVLWDGIDGKSSGEYHTGLVYANGKLYHRGGAILDAGTGKVLAGEHRGRTRATPTTKHLTWLAGDRLYGIETTKTGAQMEVYALDGKKLGASELPLLPADEARTERVIEAVGNPNWGFSYGCPFTIAGDRIYVRLNDGLYCIGAAE